MAAAVIQIRKTLLFTGSEKRPGWLQWFLMSFSRLGFFETIFSQELAELKVWDVLVRAGLMKPGGDGSD